MKRNNKNLISLIMFITVMSLLITGCSETKDYSKKGIYALGIDAATGDRQNNNCIVLVNDWGEPGYYNESNYDLMTGDAAMKLIEKIIALPDVLGNEDDHFAYEISLQYYDKDQNLIKVKKTGYGTFREDWKEIVSYANDINPKKQKLTDSTDIVVIDADLLRKEFDLKDDDLPDGVSVERFLEDTGLRYPDLYSPGYHIESYVKKYCYDYYNIASHRIKEDSQATASNPSSLKEYAQSNLDEINFSDDMSISGSFKGNEFEIVRFDCFEDWKIKTKVDGIEVSNDDTIDINYMRDAGMEDMTYSETYYVYVDESGRFLIITKCNDYEIINEYFDKEKE